MRGAGQRSLVGAFVHVEKLAEPYGRKKKAILVFENVLLVLLALLNSIHY